MDTMPLCSRCGLAAAVPFFTQPTPDSLTDSFHRPLTEDCTRLSNTIHVANEELQRIEEAIARLERERQALLEGVIKPCASVVSPIRKLPAEVLEEIFLNTLNAAQWSTWRLSALVAPSLVCRRWHQVVLHSQRLWSNIQFDPSHVAPNQVSRFHGMLESQKRICRSHPLRVEMFVCGHSSSALVIKGKDCLELVDHLAETRDRWDAATLRVSTEAAPRIFTLSGTFLSLKTLHVDLFPLPSISPPPLHLSEEMAPNLSDVKLSYSFFSSVTLPWSQLIRVTLLDITISGLCEIIPSLKRIEELNVKLSSGGPLADLVDVLEFPYTFRSFALLGLDGRASANVHQPLLHMLRAFRAPSLQTLQLSNCKWNSLPALDMLLSNPAHHSITSLTVQLFYLASPDCEQNSVEQLVQHLGKLSELRNLTASYFRTSSSQRDPGQIMNADSLFTALAERDQDRFVICPLLSSLDLSIFTVSPDILENAIWARIGRASLSYNPQLYHLKEVVLSGLALHSNNLDSDEWRASQSGTTSMEGVLRGYCSRGQHVELHGSGYSSRIC